jgi:hypothetical protein
VDAYDVRFQYAMLANVISFGDSEMTSFAELCEGFLGSSSGSGISARIRCSLPKAGNRATRRNVHAQIDFIAANRHRHFANRMNAAPNRRGLLIGICEECLKRCTHVSYRGLASVERIISVR